MELLGVKGITLKLFKDYNNNRLQRVTINGKFSSDARITHGVPQGSVLGPTLFLIYINGVCNLNIENCKIFLYAGDTDLILHSNSWNENKSKAEAGLKIATELLNNIN